MTKELVERFVRALRDAGVRACAAYPASPARRLAAPETTVSLARAAAAAAGLGHYLGARDDPERGAQELYGRSLEAGFRLRVASPVALGGERCAAEADRVADVLLAGVDGLELRGFSVEPCGYDQRTDCFVCTVTADIRARMYAPAGAQEGPVGDFTLEGELR